MTNSYNDLFKAEFKRLVGRFPSNAEMTEMERRRGIYTIREIINMIISHDLPIS